VKSGGETAIASPKRRGCHGSATLNQNNQLVPTFGIFLSLITQWGLLRRVSVTSPKGVVPGLIDPVGGQFVASQEGKALLARNPEKLNLDTLLEYPAFREWYRKDNVSDEAAREVDQEAASISPPPSKTPEEQIESAHLALHAALREELLQRILQNSSGFFERVIVELLVAMGYGGSLRNAATQLGRSGDGGVDGVINQD
jgi:restriction system protein